MNLKRCITFALTFTVLASCWSQYGRSKYPFYYNWQYVTESPTTIYKNGFSIDTLATKLGVLEKVKVSSSLHKGDKKLTSKISSFYDAMGRIIETKGMNNNGDWFYKSDYTQKNITTRSSKNYFNQYVTNDSGYVLSTYWKNFNSKGKVTSTRLTKYSYNYDKWLTTMHTNKGRKDTLEMALKLKQYYQNDTGDMIKKEIYRKGKVKYTYVYDCSLAEDAAKPKKDTTRVCRNEATDDRGYTYYTSYSYKENQTFKTVSVKNPKNKVVEINTVVLQGDKEIPTYTYISNKDSSADIRIFYNKKFTKIKIKRTLTKHRNSTGQITRANQIRQKRGKKTSYRNTYYQYYNSGLLKTTSTETINRKLKLSKQHKNEYFYVFKTTN